MIFSIIYSIFKKDLKYTFGQKVCNQIHKDINSKKYDKAETQLESLDINELTMVLDCIGLNFKIKDIEKWDNTAPSNWSKLALGIIYSHQAWIARTNDYAKNISQNQGDTFLALIEKSENILTQIPNHFKNKSEVQSRLIRVYMGLNDLENAEMMYKNAIMFHKKLVWPYLHYAEMIQPKWGGSISQIKEFVSSLPSDYIIKNAVILKLIFDSLQVDELYFDTDDGDINQFAIQKINEIDNTIYQLDTQNIQCYLIYNYMWILSKNFNLKAFEKKYFKLMNHYYTLYPFGIM